MAWQDSHAGIADCDCGARKPGRRSPSSATINKLNRELMDVSEQICRFRPVEGALMPQ
jgi:hypothetical protein